uniref:Uncharacterized protein n=1 Tax=Tanacetum cinerariifolium TaxID=118510 RepID=A0A6L2NY89_TANCI|nr:hypothetical protein [Tanacetum cinerariifolium]
MLDKNLYDLWKSKMKLYMQNREHGRMILESVEHDLLIWSTVEENGVTRTKKYVELSAAKKIQADCDMKATDIILQVEAMLTEAHEARQIFDEEKLAFLADPGVPDGQAIQTIFPNNVAFQTKDLGTYDSDCDDISMEKQFSWLTFPSMVLMLSQSKPSDALPIKAEAPKELPKISLVNESLKNLKFHLDKFDNVVKIRTTPKAPTKGEWGFEHKKANNEIISEFFENNDLKAQLQNKDSTICKLKDIRKSLREKSKEENVNYDYGEIETKMWNLRIVWQD